MKLEYGKKYKTRDGEIVGPLVEVPHTWAVLDDYKFCEIETERSWTCDGGYLDFDEVSDLDIVEEVTEESEPSKSFGFRHDAPPASGVYSLDDVVEVIPNPYTRTLPTYPDGTSDIYCVLKGYEVTCPAIAHAVKKLLAPGCRSGGKSYIQDLEEAMQSIQKAIDLEGN